MLIELMAAKDEQHNGQESYIQSMVTNNLHEVGKQETTSLYSSLSISHILNYGN